MADSRSHCLAMLACLPLLAAAAPASVPNQIETIALIRHGEKPAAGLGQLDCQGLNRALALPPVIATKFGRPDAIFAPNPGARKPDGTGTYYYIRPLATIEPTAISLGLPVNAGLAYTDIAGLQQALLAPKYHAAFVLAAWEHKQIVAFARHLLADYHGNVAGVPAWDHNDFDSIFVIRIHWNTTPPTVTFQVQKEGLTNLSTACPAPH